MGHVPVSLLPDLASRSAVLVTIADGESRNVTLVARSGTWVAEAWPFVGSPVGQFRNLIKFVKIKILLTLN